MTCPGCGGLRRRASPADHVLGCGFSGDTEDPAQLNRKNDLVKGRQVAIIRRALADIGSDADANALFDALLAILR